MKPGAQRIQEGHESRDDGMSTAGARHITRFERVSTDVCPPLPHPTGEARGATAAGVFAEGWPRADDYLVMEEGALQVARPLHLGAGYVVVRADRDGHPVVVKSVRPEQDTPRAEALLRHEYALLTALDVPGVVKPLALETSDGRPALVLEDAGPSSLQDKLRGRRLEVDTFLDLAVQMAAIVAAVHGHNVIHRDLCPANFVLGEGTHLTLVDFELATTLTGLSQGAGVSGELEATLPYLAPEQTGRMKRLVDHRADLYSLGATFYEMLVGTPPFASEDPLEVVHAHLARIPAAPAEANSRVPGVLSDMVLKLLAKMPEWRYQTAEALHADLVEVQRQWRASGRVVPFELARLDRRELTLGARLYGRERELAELTDAYARCVAGAKELLVVEGMAGIGKSALVQEIRSLAEARGRFLSGKYDQLRGDVPLAPFAEAFRGLARELLGEPEPVATAWRQRIQEAVSPNGRVLTELVPELEQFLGEQPPLPPLGPTEAESRTRLVFLSFMRALATPEHPLLLFLDDMQWVDSGSLKLLRVLALDSDIRHLLVLVAWRSEEVGLAHPAVQAIQAIREAGITVHALEVGPLQAGAVTALLCDVLHASPERARPLGALLVEKTAGNPFFLQSFLRFLQAAGLLVFDIGAGVWTWDLPRIAEAPVPENVVDLLVASIRRLPDETQEALTVAACLGSQFDVGLLARVRAQRPEDAARPLWLAIREGLLAPVGLAARREQPAHAAAGPSASYRFAHDRVQQAAYSLLSDDRRKALHLEIGRSLLEGRAEGCERLFEAVDQLNRGASLLREDTERLHLAELNERAARKAKASSAFEAALAYLRHALCLLPAEAWHSQHELSFRLHRDAAELAFRVATPEDAEALVEAALLHAQSRLEKVALHVVRVVAYSLRADFSRALQWGNEGLRLFGMELPERDFDAAIRAAFTAVEERLGGRTPDDLLDAPRVHDAEPAALQQLLADMISAAILSDPKLYTLLVLWAVRCSLEQGHSVISAQMYAEYGQILARVQGEYAKAHAFGRMGVELSRRFGDRALETRTLFVFAVSMNSWRAPLRSSVPLLRTAMAKGLESGEFQFTSYCHLFLTWTLMAQGTELDRILPVVEEGMAYSRRTGIRLVSEHLLGSRQAIRCLKGWTSRPRCFDDAEFDEAQFLASVGLNPTVRCIYATLRLQASYLLGDPSHALQMSEAAAKWIELVRSWVHEFEHCFYSALTLAALAGGASPDEEAAALARMAPLEQRLQTWAGNCPENFRHKHHLVAAERARLEGKHLEAEGLYHQAMEGAHREGFLQDQALANELCGRFYLARAQPYVAGRYLAEAIDAYARWGATAKVHLLEEEHAQLVVPGVPRWRTPVTPGSREVGLDVLTLLKAAETLSGEVVLGRLLEKLMRICLESAGAERGLLVLEEEGAPVVRAVVSATGEVSQVQVPLRAQPRLPVSVVEAVWRTGRAVVLGNAAQEGAFVSDSDVAERALKSVLAVPIHRQARRVGVIYLENNLATDAFTPERVRVFELLSSHIAVSLENSLLFEERKRAEATVRFLAEASAILAESLGFEATLAKVARLAVPFLADWCVIDVAANGNFKRVAGFHADAAKEEVLRELAARYPPGWDSPQPAGRVLRTGEPLLLPELPDTLLETTVHDAKHAELIRALGTHTAIAVPLIAHGRTLGAMTFASAKPGRRYGQADVTLAQELARRAALALDNARLYRESQEAVRQRDDFLTIATHELYTPMTALKLSVQGLGRAAGAASPEAVARTSRSAERHMQRLTGLIDELLDDSAIQAGNLRLQPEEVDLAAVARKVAGRFSEQLARAGCPLSLEAEAPVVGRWDRKRLEQVVAHLLSNALKFGAGKPIEIVVEAREGTARLVVKDSGIGIAPDRLPYVFERFERAVSVKHYGGLGLGLYIVREVVSALGGTVRAESTENVGSTFTVELPRPGPH
ncbi:AAA family ATPase [Pyxidicoccus caerfyrddinensis]|uniref:AAA family ATPase n=1 Tax=Pyxidicoccus caerfyrddinensis TaxID=2709663 RepID=UPI0030840977